MRAYERFIQLNGVVFTLKERFPKDSLWDCQYESIGLPDTMGFPVCIWLFVSEREEVLWTGRLSIGKWCMYVDANYDRPEPVVEHCLQRYRDPRLINYLKERLQERGVIF